MEADRKERSSQGPVTQGSVAQALPSSGGKTATLTGGGGGGGGALLSPLQRVPLSPAHCALQGAHTHDSAALRSAA